jgi:hypothetical protein
MRHFTHNVRLLAFAGGLILLFILAGGSAARPLPPVDNGLVDAAPLYIFCGHVGVGRNEFAIAVSGDGENWLGIPAKWATPTQYVNAPTCLRYENRWFIHAAAANGIELHLKNWYVGLMTGDDVTTIVNIDWSKQIPGLDTCFSGEWFVESGVVHLFIPCTTDKSYRSNWRTYETHPLNQQMSKWSDPVDVHVSRDRMYDSTVVKVGPAYYMWLTKLSGVYPNFSSGIQLAKSSNLLGPYRLITYGDWSNWDAAIGSHEAPTPYRHGNGWRMAMEKLGDGPPRIYFSDCSVLELDKCNWSPLKPWREDRYYRHGTVTALR